MKTLIIATILLQLGIYNPVANESAVVNCGKARFTVLTDRMIRMEWSENGRFEDEATLAVVNRNLPVPQFKVDDSKRKIVIKTQKVVLEYVKNSKFSKDNLSVSFSMYSGGKHTKKVVWHPGDVDRGNLLGTLRTLDKCGSKQDILEKEGGPCNGLISKDGWVVIDESSRHLIKRDDSDWKEWICGRDTTDRQDLYILAYGHDYTDAISDYTKIGGRVPLPPKYAFGFWSSRYWAYSDYEFIGMAERLRKEDIPADVMVIDMDWHKTYYLWEGKRVKDEFGQRIGWTGYTWNPDLFPEPETTLRQLHSLGFKTALNLHPASGVQPYEDCYDGFVKEYMSRTSDYDGPAGYIFPEGGYTYVGNSSPCGTAGQKAPVALRLEDKDFTEAYFNSIIHPLEKTGVDFWWLDWQQWLQSKYMPGMDMTFLCNHIFFTDKIRQSASKGLMADRPMIYHRWGGLGSHRYQIGFSGDTNIGWSSLEMLPWFTATASNVCYGYWGHDVGGFRMPVNGIGFDGELFTRWMQFGVFTPIFKLHSTKSTEIERNIWNYPYYSPFLKEAVRLRYSLSRYIYDAARECHNSGISICRPLYYYAPEDERSYTFENEYYFGRDIIATALSNPADSTTGLTSTTLFFPEGSDWYDMASGDIHKGGSIKKLHYAINQNPWYVRCGAIIPLAGDGLRNLQDKSEDLVILIAPGDGYSECTTFEDDGISQLYEQEYCSTDITKTSDAGGCSVEIGARNGNYRGASDSRKISIVLEGVFAPVEVKVNGNRIKYARIPENGLSSGENAVWTYDGKNLAARIIIGRTSASEKITVECKYEDDCDVSVLRGAKGLFSRLAAVTNEVKMYWPNPAVEFIQTAAAPSMINAKPADARRIIKSIDINALNDSWSRNEKLPDSFVSRMKSISIR